MKSASWGVGGCGGWGKGSCPLGPDWERKVAGAAGTGWAGSRQSRRLRAQLCRAAADHAPPPPTAGLEAPGLGGRVGRGGAPQQSPSSKVETLTAESRSQGLMGCAVLEAETATAAQTPEMSKTRKGPGRPPGAHTHRRSLGCDQGATGPGSHGEAPGRAALGPRQCPEAPASLGSQPRPPLQGRQWPPLPPPLGLLSGLQGSSQVTQENPASQVG